MIDQMIDLVLCALCDGSGEGMAADTVCTGCNGTGALDVALLREEFEADVLDAMKEGQ